MIFGISFFCFLLSVIISKIKDTKANAYFGMAGAFCAFLSAFIEKAPTFIGIVSLDGIWDLIAPIGGFALILTWWAIKISFFILCIFAPVAIATYAD